MEHIPLTVEISIQILNLSTIFSDAGTSLLYRYDWRLGYPTVIGEKPVTVQKKSCIIFRDITHE